MTGVNIFYVILISIGFGYVNFAFKLGSLFIFGNALINIFPSNGSSILYVAAAIAIILSGFLAGKITSIVFTKLPLYHSLGVAVLASGMKSFSPEINEISTSAQAFFVVLTFVSIMYGAYVFRKRPA